MTKTQEYLEKLRTKLAEVENKKVYDKRLYTLLDVPSQTFSNYINGQRTMPDHVAVKVADYLHMERLQIIAEIHEENAQTAEEKKTWSNALKLIASGFVGFTLVGALTLAPNQNAHATSETDEPSNIYYTKLKKWFISCFTYLVSHFTNCINKENLLCKNHLITIF